MPSQTKIIVVVNKNLEPGRALNAAAHAVLGLATTPANEDAAERFAITDYRTADSGGFSASKLPLIVLQATPGHLQRLRREALAVDLPVIAFHEHMTRGSWEDQIDRSQLQQSEDIELYAVASIGPAAALDPLTKRCRLY